MSGFAGANLRRVAGSCWKSRAVFRTSSAAAGAGDAAYSIDQGRSFFHVETDAFNRKNGTTGVSEITL
jgi:hypothetical protein